MSRYLQQWIFLLTVAVLAACSSSDEEAGNATHGQADSCFLDLTIVSPDRPVTTRSDVGFINARNEAESKVHTLKIWVFRHDDGSPLGYAAVGSFNNNSEGTTAKQQFRLKVPASLADSPEPVDVYVVANESSYGLSLDETTNRQALDDATIGSSYFGTASLVSSVPDGGLPMSAVLKSCSLYGQFPTLRLGTEEAPATLQLVRAVSRLRFVICRIEEKEDTKKKLVSIDQIQLNKDVIPTSSWLFAKAPYGYSYSHDAISYISNGVLSKDNIPDVADPTLFAYETQSAQEYETLIDDNLIAADQVSTTEVDGKLLEYGLTYLRESDRRLTGAIQYTTSEKENDTWETKNDNHVTFAMASEGDFLRNHSWIVYIYFMDSKIHVLTVTNMGVKEWTSGGSKDHTVYNW